MVKNELITITIDNVGSNGEGVAHYNGTTIFVPFVLPTEKAVLKILKVKGNVAFAKLEKLLVASKNRFEPICKVFGKCGGCQLQHMKYENQLESKSENVKTCLKKIAGIDFEVPLTVASPEIYGYRNKLQLPIRCDRGVNKIGFFRENSHDVVEIDDCPLHPKWVKTIIEIVKNYIAKNHVSCYDEATEKGELKHLVVREVSGKLIVVLVSANSKLNAVNQLIEGLSQNFKDFSLILNVNKQNTNVVFGREFKTLFGKEKIALNEFGIDYEIGAESFLQVNALQKTNLYNKVFELSEIDDKTVAIDGYSGAGVLTAMLAKKAKKAYGVEIIREAVDSANELAKANGLTEKMVNVCGDCAVELPQIIKKAKTENDKVVLVLDPPRKGVDASVIKQILESLPDKIVYVSCSPQSLGRDLGLLCGNLVFDGDTIKKAELINSKYELSTVIPFDMFPHTKHVETLVTISHKIPDSHIAVKVDFDDKIDDISKENIKARAEARKPQARTTYKMIQAYVEQHYGFKVHTAYIAEVKRSLGLPMYDCPNAVEFRTHEPQHPTAQMVTAITDAFKNYCII